MWLTWVSQHLPVSRTSIDSPAFLHFGAELNALIPVSAHPNAMYLSRPMWNATFFAVYSLFSVPLLCAATTRVPYYLFLIYFLIKVELIYNVVPTSAVHSHTHTHAYTHTPIYIYIHSFSHVIFPHGLSQEIGYSSLCCTVGPHCLYILNVIVCIY